MTVTIICFHTCDNRGSKKHILESVPFISNSGKTEWMGKGYYFWTDSDYYAHKWGRIPPRRGNYVITKFILNVEKKCFLDLVGDVNAQIFFKKLVEKYKSYLKNKIHNTKNTKLKKELEDEVNKVCISTVIQHCKQNTTFSFGVIKAQDMPKSTTLELSFIPDKDEFLPYPTRQQIVVYENAKNCLNQPEWYYSTS